MPLPIFLANVYLGDIKRKCWPEMFFFLFIYILDDTHLQRYHDKTN